MMNNYLKYHVTLQFIVFLILTAINCHAKPLTGKIVDISEKKITIEMENSIFLTRVNRLISVIWQVCWKC